MTSFTDARITESSGLAYSVAHPGTAYTHNDENGPIFRVNLTTGDTVATIPVGFTLVDPEAISVDKQGRIWLFDIGDNDAERSTVAVYVAPESNTSKFARYVLKYPDGPHNAECGLTRQNNNEVRIVTKDGRVYQLPDNLVAGSTPNLLKLVKTGLPSNISDGSYTPDGRFVVFLRKDDNDTVYVHDATTWASAGDPFTFGALTKPEGITVEPDQDSVWISSEGLHAPLRHVALPDDYRKIPAPVPAPTANPCGDSSGGTTTPPAPAPTPPATPPPLPSISLLNWKLTLPVNTAHAGNPDEILQPELQTYSSTWFKPARGVPPIRFRAHCGGATTGGSSYPRSELREMKNNGTDEATWRNNDGKTHVMAGDCALTYTMTNKKHVVCAQIHDADDDVFMIRLETRRLFVEHDGDEIALLDANYTLGRRFTYKITAANGKFAVDYNGVRKALWSQSASGLYFKAGMYTQSNTDYDDADKYGDAFYYALKVSHT